MIIEMRRGSTRPIAWIGAALAGAVIWFGAVAASALVLPVAGASMFAPDALAVAARLPDVRLETVRPVRVTLRSDQPALAWRLYRAGAWLVWPSWARMGCRPDAGRLGRPTAIAARSR